MLLGGCGQPPEPAQGAEDPGSVRRASCSGNQSRAHRRQEHRDGAGPLQHGHPRAPHHSPQLCSEPRPRASDKKGWGGSTGPRAGQRARMLPPPGAVRTPRHGAGCCSPGAGSRCARQHRAPRLAFPSLTRSAPSRSAAARTWPGSPGPAPAPAPPRRGAAPRPARPRRCWATPGGERRRRSVPGAPQAPGPVPSRCGPGGAVPRRPAQSCGRIAVPSSRCLQHGPYPCRAPSARSRRALWPCCP